MYLSTQYNIGSRGDDEDWLFTMNKIEYYVKKKMKVSNYNPSKSGKIFYLKFEMNYSDTFVLSNFYCLLTWSNFHWKAHQEVVKVSGCWGGWIDIWLLLQVSPPPGSPKEEFDFVDFETLLCQNTKVCEHVL